MSARDRLTELIRTHPDYADMIAPEDLADEILDEHAHELAERQREAIPEIMEREQGYLHQDLLTELADLIDPQMP